MQKNPKRVAAGKLNRAKRGPLSAASRARLRAAALRSRPWLRSTGPKSAAGKAISAANGRARQTDALSVRQVRALLAGLSPFLTAMAAARAAAGPPGGSPSSGGRPRPAASGGRPR